MHAGKPVTDRKGERSMWLLLLLIVLLLAAVPAWPYSKAWGYRPSGLLGAIMVMLIVLVLLGRLHL